MVWQTIVSLYQRWAATRSTVDMDKRFNACPGQTQVATPIAFLVILSESSVNLDLTLPK